MADLNAEYRQRFLRKQLQIEKKYRFIFNKIADDFAQLAYDPNIKFAKAFRFPKYVQDRMKVIMANFHDQSLQLMESEITDRWVLSNQKNDKLVNNYLNTIGGIKASQAAPYFMANTAALKAFLSSTHGSETLSQSIWKVGNQYRKELETHLGIGITNGDSAQVISRRIRQYLKEPETVFRRIRNAQGRLVASKAMQEYKPGRGVYKSAYKNAMRVARSEANNAYHLADQLRWQQLPMVKGFKVSLSASHRVYDICDECQGEYPKDFVWVSWHSQCLCNCVPVMESQQDFLEYLRTGEQNMNGYVTQYPKGFIDYVDKNFERLSGYKSKPYFLIDNAEIISGIVNKSSK